MSLRQFVLAAVVSGVTLAAAASASAATVLDFSSSNVGVAQTIDFNGYVPGSTTTIDPKLHAVLTLTLDKIVGNVWTFSYALDNTSTETSRMGAIGWNVAEANGSTALTNNFTGAIVTGSGIGSGSPYTNVGSGQMASLDKLDLCLNGGGGCAGGGGAGPSNTGATDPTSGEFSLTFPTSVVGKHGVVTPIPAPTALEFSDFETHYQSLTVGDSTVGRGSTPTVSGVPEPATWALMLLSFFGLGATLRRRRGQGLAQAALG